MERVSARAATAPEEGRVHLGQLHLDRVALADVMERVSRAIEERTPCHIVTANLQFVGIAAREPDFAHVVNNAQLVVADGKPLVWLSRLMGSAIPQRITGHDLLHSCASLASKRGYSIFFLGASPKIAEKAADVLCAQYPRLKIAGFYQGRFERDGWGVSKADELGALTAIQRCRPDILFVALGCPKQEFWIYRHLQDIESPVCVGIGGVLDVLSGKLKRAPVWMQSVGLEWSYRLIQEPKRLWRRYILQDCPTAMRLAGSALLRQASLIKQANGRHS